MLELSGLNSKGATSSLALTDTMILLDFVIDKVDSYYISECKPYLTNLFCKVKLDSKFTH